MDIIKRLWRTFTLGKLMERVEDTVGRDGIYDGYYKLTFSLEYSDTIDWVVDFTPSRNHPKARQLYEFVGSQELDLVKALQKAFIKLEESDLKERAC